MSLQFLVAFDFDHTICDDNSDIVARKLISSDKIPDTVKRMYQPDNWNAYMGTIFQLLNANFIDVKTIKDAINRIPSVNGIDDLLSELHSRNCEIIIISDSNSLFIDWWLKHKGLSHTVKEIFTNPATIKEDMLKIEMYHEQDHCKLSSKNLCKGQILDDYISKRSLEGIKFKRIIYIGDGKNDFCPILRLSEKDVACPRIGYTLVNILKKTNEDKSQQVKAKVIPWETGNDILENLKNLNNIENN